MKNKIKKQFNEFIDRLLILLTPIWYIIILVLVFTFAVLVFILILLTIILDILLLIPAILLWLFTGKNYIFYFINFIRNKFW